MKSTEVYACLKEVLGPWTKANGFKRTKSFLGWFKPHGDRFLTFWFQCSRDGWDDFAGSKFAVEFQLDQMSEPGGLGTRARIARFLDSNQLERAHQLQNDVISKLEKPPSGHFLLQSAPELRDYYLSKFQLLSVPPTNQSDLWLRYHDEDDVRRWGSFVLDALPGILRSLAP